MKKDAIYVELHVEVKFLAIFQEKINCRIDELIKKEGKNCLNEVDCCFIDQADIMSCSVVEYQVYNFNNQTPFEFRMLQFGELIFEIS